MSFTDPIADMITRIRNAKMRLLSDVSIPSSKFRAKILDVLKDEGFISNYKFSGEDGKKGELVVNLKYNMIYIYRTLGTVTVLLQGKISGIL